MKTLRQEEIPSNRPSLCNNISASLQLVSALTLLLFWFPRNWADDVISLFLPLLVQDWPFDDGAPPSNQIVDDWLNLLKLKFREEPGCCVAVHCVAGLGR